MVSDTDIFPCKACLMDAKWDSLLQSNERLGLEDIIQQLRRHNKTLSVIIDLNQSFDYYNAEEFKRQNPEYSGIEYKKGPYTRQGGA